MPGGILSRMAPQASAMRCPGTATALEDGELAGEAVVVGDRVGVSPAFGFGIATSVCCEGVVLLFKPTVGIADGEASAVLLAACEALPVR